MIKNKKVALILFLSILIYVVLFPYMKVEILTIQHMEEFNNLYKVNSILNEIEYMKIMNYSKQSAEVYYVAKDKKAGLLYKFIKEDDDAWRLTQWDAIWSKSGSADNFIWSYYR